jgi:gentisate 1,2-dioxygenase
MAHRCGDCQDKSISGVGNTTFAGRHQLCQSRAALRQFFGAIFRENYPGETHPVSQVEGAAAPRYGSNLMPLEYRPQCRASPLLVYPYDRTREALERVVRSEPLHPRAWREDALRQPKRRRLSLAVFIQWMPKGFSGQTYRSTDGAVFNVVEGHGRESTHRRNRFYFRAARCVRGVAVDVLLHRD